jgi:predicted AAA+ superfamily ATPase
VNEYFQRSTSYQEVAEALNENPVVAILGPRQCGKTTLARQFLQENSSQYFDLEDPVIGELMKNPMTILKPLRGLVVIDEAQRQPGLFPVLRVLADRADQPAKFLILGSATPELSRQTSESLAGRIAMIELRGFNLEETNFQDPQKLWLRGGFPRSYLAATDAASDRWRKNFVQTFLERDLALLGFATNVPMMQRFWRLICHHHGQIWNAAPLASTLGVSAHTIRNYLDVLTQTYMIRQLHPWHVNLGKRQVKAPKIYLRDSGVLHHLLGIRHHADLIHHPAYGASWEGFALEETLAHFRPEQVYFWATHGGAELDLLMIIDGKKIGVEFKHVDVPKATRSMHTALADLGLEKLLVVYPGERAFSLQENIHVVPLTRLQAD